MDIAEIINRMCEIEGFSEIGDYGAQTFFAKKFNTSNQKDQNKKWIINKINQTYTGDILEYILTGKKESLHTENTKKAEESNALVSHLATQELIQLSKLAGRYEELKEQNEKLENRHKKLLEGLSAAIGDYSKMYGPIEGLARTAQQEKDALKDQLEGSNPDSSEHPRRGEGSDIQDHTPPAATG